MPRVVDLTQSSDDAAPADNAQLRALEDAIRVCPTDILVESVIRLVRTDHTVQRAFSKELVGVSKKRKNNAPAAAPVAKWQTCDQCGEHYDATEEDQECCYHDGELEVDEECFEDHDEDCHGPMDTPANRRDWPENFKWTCCDETTNSEGCRTGEHVPKQDKRRRVR
ncbi:hypothetical protein EXIGLDRAFT_832568 [Exidia glandulosa HHB12029]|uniref:C2H2-type domain-containing protein n=1 Tax=Exidia glandulosa HHB12029 TaxID=1314781 RepID=A0A165LGK9_EXIGL|nr:hypothetical protein EXIGLDRAFT_832568 [Exidia glandulosa HHB12029]